MVEAAAVQNATGAQIDESTFRDNRRWIVAATNMPLRDAMREGRFREDLYYRLSVIELALPPLAERRDDVMPLTRAFLPSGARLSGDAERALRNYPWPGNVRELRNVVQRAYLMAADGIITDEWLPRDAPAAPGPTGTAPAGNSGSITVRLGTTLAEAEYQLILATLQHFNNHKERTAAVLGVSLKTLYNRLKEYAGTKAVGAEAVADEPSVSLPAQPQAVARPDGDQESGLIR